MKTITPESVTVLLSQACVEDLNLKPGTQMELEVQFLLNRVEFCKMHHILDSLNSAVTLVVPDLTRSAPLTDTTKYNIR